jgi:putative DNA primase/helicase
MTANPERAGIDPEEPQAQAGDVGPQRLEDAYLGERIARDHLEGKFLHASAFGWMKFDGRRWMPVSEEIVAEVVRVALTEFHCAQARSGADPARLQQTLRTLSTNRIRAILWIVKLRVTTDETFDAHPDLLNVRNGVVDLRDGTLRSHDPRLLLTKVTMVDYQPLAVHADWERALTALPADAAEWLQLRIGQGVTGYPVPDDRLVVLKGSGSNGKTTIVDALREALGGDYVVTLPERVLLARNGDHPTEMMVLRGARLALMEEFPELGHVNIKRVKDLHGTGEMSARHIAKDTVSWKPSHTVFVTTNYIPRVDESDDGTWRRLAMVDFPYHYREAHETYHGADDLPGDPNLRGRLRAGGDGQHEAVLAWVIAGAVRWYQNDRRMSPLPPSVHEATQAWRKSSDLLMRYMDDNLVFDSHAHVISTELFEDFKAWLKANGNVLWSDQSFTTRLSQHSEAMTHRVEKKRGVRASRPGLSRPQGICPDTAGGPHPKASFTAWLGIRFRTQSDEPESDHDSDE